MNHDELASLLAQVHSQLHSPSRPQYPKNPRAHPQSPSSPLSPRQIFQSRIRNLSDDGRLPREHSLSPTSRSHQLNHLSSLRVHVRDPSNSKSPYPSQRPKKSRSIVGRLEFSTTEPEFVAEERAAWGATQPHEGDAISSQDTFPRLSDNVPHASTYTESRLEDDEAESLSHILIPFGPSSGDVNLNDRPKTSRGSGEGTQSFLGALPHTETQASEQALRKSRFLEGSMTARSVATASTWNEHGLRLSESSDRSEETDSDATPRAPRLSRSSTSSSDLAEFRPAPTTPSTIKGKLTKLVKRSTEAPKPLQQEQKPKRKGLRKSISTWSFQNLGDKMKFFGASSSDLSVQQEGLEKDPEKVEKEGLNDRKRRAEEAYAQQFGTKKQKSNDGISIHGHTATDSRSSSRPRTLKKVHISPRTSTLAASNLRQRQGSGSTIRSTRSSQDSGDILSESDHDHRKQPSRSELEKENHQLRTMLREQQAQRGGLMHRSASKSNLHLPIDTRNSRGAAHNSASPTRVSHHSTSTTPPGGKSQQKQHHSKGVPPVPQLPSRTVLATLGNANQRNTNNQAGESGTVNRTRGNGFPRPVSMILEEDVENEGGSEETSVLKPHPTLMPSEMQRRADRKSRREDWTWPDDVF